MILKKLFIILGAPLILFSCGNGSDVQFPQTKNLKVERIEINEIIFPIHMVLKEGKLVVSSYKTDTMLYFYSVPDLKYIAADGRKGEGPMEFTFSPSFCENTSDKLVVNKLGNMLNLSEITLDSLNKIFIKKIFKLSMVDPLNSMFIKNDSILLYSDFPRLSVRKYDLGKKEFIDEIIIAHDKKPGDSFHPDSGDVIYNDSTIIYSYKYRNRIDIYNLETMKLKKSIVSPGDTYIAETIKEAKNSIYYYLGGYAGKKYFYIYYKGDTFEKEDGVTLRTFDYDGNPVIEYSFDILPAHPFVVDEDNGYLYAYDNKGEKYFLRYKL